MTDLSKTIAPKSDQLNADDLIAGPRVIKVTKVSLRGEPDQPIAINFEGDGGKPFLPGKSMRRVLVHVWGGDGNAYAGRSMRIYRDEKVLFGGVAVGGIRISHMTGIDVPVTMALTASKAKRAPFTVRPLEIAEPAEDKAAVGARALVARMAAVSGLAELTVITADADVIKRRKWLATNRPELAAGVDAAVAAVLLKFEGAEPDDESAEPFGDE